MPPSVVALIRYSSGFSTSTIIVRLQSSIYEIQVPISLRVSFLKSKSGGLLFSSYSAYSFKFLNTWVSTLRNIVWGSLSPFYILLEVRGLGYKVGVKGSRLEFSLGFSHLVYFKLPTVISAKPIGAKLRAISVISPDWLLLTQAVAAMKRLRRVNVYKERGIFYRGEVCRGLKSVKRKK